MSTRQHGLLWHLLLFPIAALFALPLIWMVLSAVKTSAEINVFPPTVLPKGISLEGFRTVVGDANYPRWFVNTVIVTVTAVISQLIFCSLAAYGFARLRFRGSAVVMFALLSTIFIPQQLLMIPTFLLFTKLHLVDTLPSLIAPWLVGAFGVFMMRQFFLSLPRELEDAALIDGCGHLGVFMRVVLPAMRPALVTLAIFTVLSTWNDLLWPLVSITNEKNYTLQLGLTTFQGQRHSEWAALMAGNMLATGPLLIAFILAQRHFIQSMTFAGIKG